MKNNNEIEIKMTAFGLFVEGVLLVIIGTVGVVGNTVCIVTFSRKIIQKNFHRLMLSLAVFDIIYLIVAIFLFGGPQLISRLRSSDIYHRLFPILLPMARVSIQGSIYHTIAIAVERYFIVCHPFYKVSHQWTAQYYIIPISMFAIIYNIPAFMELQVCRVEAVTNATSTSTLANKGEDLMNVTSSSSHPDNATIFFIDPQNILETSVCPTPLRLNPVYIRIYIMYLNMIVNGIIPLLSLIILNTAIYRKLRLIRDSNSLSTRDALHSREVRLAQVSLIIVAVFIICHGVKWIPNVWEFRQAGVKPEDLHWPGWVKNTVHLSHLLTVFNSSVNFFIYFFKHRAPYLCMQRTERRFSDQATNMSSLVTLTPRLSNIPVSVHSSCDLEQNHSDQSKNHNPSVKFRNHNPSAQFRNHNPSGQFLNHTLSHRNVTIDTVAELNPLDASSAKYKEGPEKDKWKIVMVHQITDDEELEGFSSDEVNELVKLVCNT